MLLELAVMPALHCSLINSCADHFVSMTQLEILLGAFQSRLDILMVASVSCSGFPIVVFASCPANEQEFPCVAQIIFPLLSA